MKFIKSNFTPITGPFGRALIELGFPYEQLDDADQISTWLEENKYLIPDYWQEKHKRYF